MSCELKKNVERSDRDLSKEFSGITDADLKADYAEGLTRPLCIKHSTRQIVLIRKSKVLRRRSGTAT